MLEHHIEEEETGWFPKVREALGRNELQAFYPDPSRSTGDGSMLYLEFDPPPGEVFSVDLDAYIQPSSQLGRRGEVALMDGERVRVRVDYRTWLVP